MIWRCPTCKGSLAADGGGARCGTCAARYESFGGILDLRLAAHLVDYEWVDYEEDRELAVELLREEADLTLEQLIRRTGRWREQLATIRVRQLMEAPARLREDLRSWLRPCLAKDGIFLDLGCGSGTLIAAASAEGYRGIGMDLRLAQLVLARRLIKEWGGEPQLAAGSGESLPLADASVTGVISLDVIEHVEDRSNYLKEIERVTAARGRVALSTPNRYSLTAEPHVYVWGVGWLPPSLQRRYVRWRTGYNYVSTRLLSSRELARLLRQNTRFDFTMLIPPVSREEMSHYPYFRRFLAKVYNRLARLSWMHRVFLMIGPFFRVVGEKPGGGR